MAALAVGDEVDDHRRHLRHASPRWTTRSSQLEVRRRRRAATRPAARSPAVVARTEPDRETCDDPASWSTTTDVTDEADGRSEADRHERAAAACWHPLIFIVARRRSSPSAPTLVTDNTPAARPRPPGRRVGRAPAQAATAARRDSLDAGQRRSSASASTPSASPSPRSPARATPSSSQLPGVKDRKKAAAARRPDRRAPVPARPRRTARRRPARPDDASPAPTDEPTTTTAARRRPPPTTVPATSDTDRRRHRPTAPATDDHDRRRPRPRPRPRRTTASRRTTTAGRPRPRRAGDDDHHDAPAPTTTHRRRRRDADGRSAPSRRAERRHRRAGSVVVTVKDGQLRYSSGPVGLSGDALSRPRPSTPRAAVGRSTCRHQGQREGRRPSPQFNACSPAVPPARQRARPGSIAIVLDGEVHVGPGHPGARTWPTSRPSRSPATSAESEAKDLALVLRYGALPVELERQRRADRVGHARRGLAARRPHRRPRRPRRSSPST